jgi:hypothetical protein
VLYRVAEVRQAAKLTDLQLGDHVANPALKNAAENATIRANGKK